MAERTRHINRVRWHFHEIDPGWEPKAARSSMKASTAAINGLITRIKRIGLGFRSLRDYRIRALLYAGRPNWDLPPTSNLTEL